MTDHVRNLAVNVARLSTGRHFLAFVPNPPRVIMLGPRDALLLKLLGAADGSLAEAERRLKVLIPSIEATEVRRRTDDMLAVGVLELERTSTGVVGA